MLRAQKLRHTGLVQPALSGPRRAAACQHHGQRLGLTRSHGHKGVCRIRGGRRCLRHEHHQRRVHRGVGQHRTQAGLDARCVRIRKEIHGIVGQVLAGQQFIQRAPCVRIERGQRQLRVRRHRIGGNRAGPCAIGQDRQTPAAWSFAQRQQARRGEQLHRSLRAYRAGSCNGGIEHAVRARQRGPIETVTSVTISSKSAAQDHHRLHTRQCAQARHEAARSAHRLQVQQHAVGESVVQVEIQQLAHFQIARAAQREDRRKAHPGAHRPVDERGGERPRFGQHRNPARLHVPGRKARLQADRGPHERGAVGADQVNARGSRLRLQMCLGGTPGLGRQIEPMTVAHHEACAARCAVGHDLRHRLRGHGSQRHIGRKVQVAQTRYAGLAQHARIFRVDRDDAALESFGTQPFEQQAADRPGALGRAQQRDRFGGEQG